jgi:hypothetical protein
LGPNGFTLGVKAEIEKESSICPKLSINDEDYIQPCIGPKAQKKRIQLNLRGQFKFGRGWGIIYFCQGFLPCMMPSMDG